MRTQAANLYPAPKIRLETQCIYQVRTGQFTISGTVLNIFSSADRDDIKVKSSIFPFALKAKQKKKKYAFTLFVAKLGMYHEMQVCCDFGTWLLFSEASKDAVADSAEVYVGGKDHWTLPQRMKGSPTAH